MNTYSNAPYPLTAEAYDAALKAVEALGPPPPRVEFFEAPAAGKGWVAVLVDGEPAGLLSPEQFAEVKAKLGEGAR